MTQCQSVSTFEREVQNSLSVLEPCSMDSLDHQHSTKKLSHKIALHFKVLCKSKATLPLFLFSFLFFCLLYFLFTFKNQNCSDVTFIQRRQPMWNSAKEEMYSISEYKISVLLLLSCLFCYICLSQKAQYFQHCQLVYCLEA